MFPRKRLDIGWLDLASAGLACATVGDREARARRVEAAFAAADGHGAGDHGGRGAFACLSVRSGLDVFLEATALPRGSEVLVSALTIPDMLRVLERHGLVPVPVDVDPDTLEPRREACERAASPRTRALLLAHLFGTRLDLDPWARLARERGWLLLEDCAQAFVGLAFTGHPAADASMFSFGPIKTQTALAGGVLLVRDAGVLERMRAVQRTLPVAGRGAFARRVAKYAALKLLSYPTAYGAFARLCALRGDDLDAFVRRSTRGFAGGDLFVKIRHQPSAPLCALLERRLARFDQDRLARRTWSGEWMSARRPSGVRVPGARAPEHSYWVYAIELADPERVPALVAALRRAGFDATHAATLEVVPAPHGRPDLEPTSAAELMAGLVYLPVSLEVPRRALARLAALLERELGPGEDAGERVVELVPHAAPARGHATAPRLERPV